MNRFAMHNPELFEELGGYDGYHDWMREQADRLNEPKPCVVCGENLTRGGRTCRRCQDSLEYDRLERESNR